MYVYGVCKFKSERIHCAYAYIMETETNNKKNERSKTLATATTTEPLFVGSMLTRLFAYSGLDSLVDISTGIVADKTVIIAMQRTTLVLSQFLS